MLLSLRLFQGKKIAVVATAKPVRAAPMKYLPLNEPLSSSSLILDVLVIPASTDDSISGKITYEIPSLTATSSKFRSKEDESYESGDTETLATQRITSATGLEIVPRVKLDIMELDLIPIRVWRDWFNGVEMTGKIMKRSSGLSIQAARHK